MIPHADNALRMLSQRLMTQLLPDLKSLYSLSDGAMIGLLINAVADELSEGIQRRLKDMEEMSVIFEEAGELLLDSEKQQVSVPLASHTLADVNNRHDALTRVLITLHARSEEESESINHAIWAYLHRTAERHRIVAVP